MKSSNNNINEAKPSIETMVDETVQCDFTLEDLEELYRGITHCINSSPVNDINFKLFQKHFENFSHYLSDTKTLTPSEWSALKRFLVSNLKLLNAKKSQFLNEFKNLNFLAAFINDIENRNAQLTTSLINPSIYEFQNVLENIKQEAEYKPQSTQIINISKAKTESEITIDDLNQLIAAKNLLDANKVAEAFCLYLCLLYKLENRGIPSDDINLLKIIETIYINLCSQTLVAEEDEQILIKLFALQVCQRIPFSERAKITNVNNLIDEVVNNLKAYIASNKPLELKNFRLYVFKQQLQLSQSLFPYEIWNELLKAINTTLRKIA